MKDPDIPICDVIESKKNEILDKIKHIDIAIEADPLHSDLRILDWILYKVCKDQQKKLVTNVYQ